MFSFSLHFCSCVCPKAERHRTDIWKTDRENKMIAPHLKWRVARLMVIITQGKYHNISRLNYVHKGQFQGLDITSGFKVFIVCNLLCWWNDLILTMTWTLRLWVNSHSSLSTSCLRKNGWFTQSLWRINAHSLWDILGLLKSSLHTYELMMDSHGCLETVISVWKLSDTINVRSIISLLCFGIDDCPVLDLNTLALLSQVVKEEWMCPLGGCTVCKCRYEQNERSLSVSF